MSSASKVRRRAESAATLVWCRHAVLLGAGLGAALGLSNQIALRASDADGMPSIAASAAAVLCSTGTGALWMAILAGLTAPLLSWARRLALAVVGLGAGTLALVYLLSLLLRVISGAYLSLGAMLFGLNGNAHLIEAALHGYSGELAFAASLTLATGVAAVVSARRALASAHEGARPALLGVMTALCGAALLPVMLVRAPEEASPELALLSSLLPPPTDVAPDPQHPSRVHAGPPLAQAQSWLSQAHSKKGSRPNLLLTVLESVPHNHLGHTGYPRPVSENLDRIARRSHRFTRAWSTATHSNYAQMAILSSLFPRRGHGLDVYRHIDYPRFLFQDAAHALGYGVAAISSQDENWQGMLRFQTTSTPLFRWHAPTHEGPHLDIGSELAAPDHVTVDQALSWLKRHEGPRPWALYLNLQATHFPYPLPAGEPHPFRPDRPGPEFNYLRYPANSRQTAINRYDNALSYVDRQLGRLARYLSESGQLDDTIWVITADHGEMFFEHGLVTHGKSLFDAEARVPLMFHYPARLSALVDDRPVSHLDILPSVLDLLGLPPHPSFQGRSVFEPDAELTPAPVYMNIQGLKTAEALVCFPWKVIVERSGRRVRLFHLERDPGELEDLATREVKVAEALRRTLDRQIRAQHAYHAAGSALRTRRHAPRLAPCPELDDHKRATLPRVSKPPPAAAETTQAPAAPSPRDLPPRSPAPHPGG